MMISVQSPGYTGMDRFGDESTYGSPPNDRSHRRIHSDLLQSRDMLIDSDASLASTITKKIKCNGKSSHDLHYSSYSSQQRHCGLKRCPHHVALPDNEWDTVDSRLQLSNSYQRAEITRTYIKPPPNRTALDIPPDHEYSLFPSSTTSPNMHHHHHHHYHHNRTATTAVKQSKQNPIAKFLLRISSSKSNENNSGYSSFTSNSLSSQSTATAAATTTAPSPTKSIASMTSSSSNHLPTYSESQLMHKQQRQQGIGATSSSWSTINQNTDFDGGLKVTVNIGHTPMSRSSSPRAPSPSIYKSRSMCNSFSSISTLPTSMINNIVNNSATVGSSSSMSSMASCPDTTDAKSINDNVSVNADSTDDVGSSVPSKTNNDNDGASASAAV